MNSMLQEDSRRSLVATGGLVAFGALLTENLILFALMLHPGTPAAWAVTEALFKAVVLVMMRSWPALLMATVGVLLIAFLALSSLQSPDPAVEHER